MVLHPWPLKEPLVPGPGPAAPWRSHSAPFQTESTLRLSLGRPPAPGPLPLASNFSLCFSLPPAPAQVQTRSTARAEGPPSDQKGQLMSTWLGKEVAPCTEHRPVCPWGVAGGIKATGFGAGSAWLPHGLRHPACPCFNPASPQPWLWSCAAPSPGTTMASLLCHSFTAPSLHRGGSQSRGPDPRSDSRSTHHHSRPCSSPRLDGGPREAA